MRWATSAHAGPPPGADPPRPPAGVAGFQALSTGSAGIGASDLSRERMSSSAGRTSLMLLVLLGLTLSSLLAPGEVDEAVPPAADRRADYQFPAGRRQAVTLLPHPAPVRSRH